MGILNEKIEGTKISADITSTNLKNCLYDTKTKTLLIEFNNNSLYEYYDVPWEIFTKFRMSESNGKYFSANIAKAYKFKKVK